MLAVYRNAYLFLPPHPLPNTESLGGKIYIKLIISLILMKNSTGAELDPPIMTAALTCHKN